MNANNLLFARVKAELAERDLSAALSLKPSGWVDANAHKPVRQLVAELVYGYASYRGMTVEQLTGHP